MGKLPLAITGVIGGSGVISFGGYSVYSAMQPKTVREKLLQKGFKLVSDIKDISKLNESWEKVAFRYKIEADSSSKIGSWNIDNITKDNISSWCSTHLPSKIEEDLYSKASRWCVVFTSLGERLKQDGKTLNSDVQSLKRKYDGMSEDLKNVINAINITVSSNTEGEKTKKWCSNLSNRAFVDIKDSHYRNLINYCI